MIAPVLQVALGGAIGAALRYLTGIGSCGCSGIPPFRSAC
jgi:fluoride ion exporter CrcB/FEX